MPEKSYFSVNYDLLSVGHSLGFDLYVNSSSMDRVQKFVRIFPADEEFSEDDWKRLREKYQQVYISEDQRNIFLRSLAKDANIEAQEAVTVIKDSAIKYLHKIFDEDKQFSTELLSETIDGCRDAVESMIDVLDDYNIDGLKGLIGSLSGHDFYTYDHSINVSMYCITVLRAVKPNASRSELMHAGLGGLLHDLGKIKIPTYILNSPAGLTDQEYTLIKQHPDYGIELLALPNLAVASDIDLKVISRIIHEHHENWDGKGYPNGLKEREIHPLARVCTIADFFDAVTTKRSYADVLPISKAIDVMEKTTGKKLDPKMFKAFAARVEHNKIESTQQLKMADSFDPSIPYEEFPLEEIEINTEKAGFGKIKFLDDEDES